MKTSLEVDELPDVVLSTVVPLKVSFAFWCLMVLREVKISQSYGKFLSER
jgi:hypothetical protein